MSRILPLVLFLMFGVVSANFDFFGNVFGHQHQQQQQPPPSGASHWAAQVDSVPCSEYLCSVTLDCVGRPFDCPCPDIQDIKCRIPGVGGDDDAYVCVRGDNGCTEVERLLLKGANPSKTK